MNIKNIKLEVSYEGTNFCGFQIQPNQKTVQGEIQRAIKKLTKENIKVISSGRTDAGVHARKAVVNFHIESGIPVEKWTSAINPLLPDDVVITKAEEVPIDFHARFDVKEKVYRYTIYNEKIIDVFSRRYTYHYPYELDVNAMNESSKLFLGKHDFTAFSSLKTDKENKVRMIYESRVWQEENKIIFQISGNGFLYKMVRIITGNLLEIGKLKMSPGDIEYALLEKKQNKYVYTVPAKGLVLWDVKY